MKRIRIELSPESCKAAIQELKDYQKQYKAKLNEICKRVAEFGLTRAEIYYSQAAYDGIKDYALNVEPINNGYALKASGRTVMFLEFGAGVHYPDDHPKAPDLGVYHGDYGVQGKNDYWFYTGQPGTAGGELAYGHTNSTITHGNPASMALFKTGYDMQYEIEQIAKDVFKT